MHSALEIQTIREKRPQLCALLCQYDNLVALDPQSWAPPTWKFKVFVSSTFTDTMLERNILLDKILPRIRAQAAEHSVEVAFIDMRYGVRDENTLDHLTWIACYNELVKCRNDSMGLYFLSLQGYKYGYQPIPKYVAKDIWEIRYPTWPADVRAIASKWYLLDRNSIPPCFVLKNLPAVNDSEFWDTVLPKMRTALENIAFDPDKWGCLDLLVGRSVTEWEAKCALSDDSSMSRCMWFRRVFDAGADPADDPKWQFNDARDESTKLKFNNLIAHMQSRFVACGCRSLIAEHQTTLKSYLAENDDCTRYKNAWRTDMEARMDSELQRIVEVRRQWLCDTNGLGVAGDLIEDMMVHTGIWLDHCKAYVDRDTDLLDRAMGYIAEDFERERGDRNSDLLMVCLGVVGESGHGKSAFMSRLAMLTSQRERLKPDVNDRRRVVIRYCGASKYSCNVVQLLKSICIQLQFDERVTEDPGDPIFPDHDDGDDDSEEDKESNGGLKCLFGPWGGELDVPAAETFEAVVYHFHELMNSKNAVVFLDGVDLLEDTNLARSSLIFLQEVGYNGFESRVVLSTSLDGEGGTDSWAGCSTRLKMSRAPTVVLPTLKADEAERMLVSTLQRQQRVLTAPQLQYVLQQVAVEATPQYVRLAADVTFSWRSTDDSKDTVLAPTVPGLVNQLLDACERNFGVIFVRSAVCFLCLSRDGLNDGHMLDLLSMDDTVLDSVFQYSRPGVPRLPVHVWLRLRAALDCLLIEGDFGKLRWNQRRVKGIVAARYSDDDILKSHRIIGTYFTNIGDRNVMAERLIQEQLLSLNAKGVPPWTAGCVVNRSRCIEGAHHLIKSGMVIQAAAELCSLDVVCGCAMVGHGFDVVRMLATVQDLLRADPTSPPSTITRVEHYYRWLRRDMSTIVSNPPQQLFATVVASQPSESVARLDAEGIVAGTSATAVTAVRAKHKVPASQEWVCCKSFGESISTVDPLLLDIVSVSDTTCGEKGDQYPVVCVCCSPDGRRIVHCAWRILQLFDAITGENVLNTVAVGDPITTVCFSHDSKHLFSNGSADFSVVKWNALTGEQEARFSGHTAEITSVCTFPSSVNRIASGSKDKTVRVWDVDDGVCLGILKGQNEVTSACVSSDGSMLAAGSDGMIILWNVWPEQVQKNFEQSWPLTVLGYGHKQAVVSVQFTTDGNRLISAGSADNKAIVWSLEAEEPLFELCDHEGHVFNACFSFDETKVVTCSMDCTVRVWSSTDGAPISVLKKHSNYVKGLCIHPQTGILASSSDDGTTKLWDISDLDRDSGLLETKRHQATCVCFNRLSTLLACSFSNGYVKVWRAPECFLVAELLCSDIDEDFPELFGHSSVQHCCFNNSGTMLATTCCHESIRLWNTTTWELAMRCDCSDFVGLMVSFNSNDSMLAIVGPENKLQIWEIGADKLTKKCSLQGHKDDVTYINFNLPGSKQLMSSGSDGKVFLWDVESGKPKNIWTSSEDDDDEYIKIFSFSDDFSRALFASSDSNIYVVDASTWIVLRTIERYSAANTVDIGPKFSFCIAATGLSGSTTRNPVVVFDPATGDTISELLGHTDTVTCVTVDKTGTVIASCSEDGAVKLWKLK